MKVRWLSIILVIHSVAVRAPASEVDEFLKSYREARARLLSRYERCRASGVMTDTLTDVGASSPRRRMVQEYEYVRMGDDEKIIFKIREATIGGEDKLKDYSAGTLIRRGSRVYAVKGSTEEGNYSLAYRGGTDDPISVRELDRYRRRFFRPTCDAPGFNLPVYLDKPELSVKSVKPVTRDGESLVRVDYTVRLSDPKLPLQRAWCLLRPDWDWSLREFETTYGSASPFSYSGVVSYEPGSGPAPKPKAIQLKYTLPGSVQVTDFPYDRFDFVESPAKDFSLAPYGLGEVESPPSRPKNRLLLWFGGIALVALILSVWLRVVMMRRGRGSPAV
jgi:hypothetical protein